MSFRKAGFIYEIPAFYLGVKSSFSYAYRTYKVNTSNKSLENVPMDFCGLIIQPEDLGLQAPHVQKNPQHTYITPESTSSSWHFRAE